MEVLHVLGVHMYIGHFYRHPMTQFWNKILPNRLANPPAGGVRKSFEALPPAPPIKTTQDVKRLGNRPEFIFGKPAEGVARARPTASVYGVVKSAPEDIAKEKKTEKKKVPMDGPMNQVYYIYYKYYISR